MIALGPLSFAAPWALLALAALPALWWLLRVTPPTPSRVPFPPVRLLMTLTAREQTPAAAPPWLIALRLVLAGAVIVGAAQPLINAAPMAAGDGPLVLVIDDGWASAADWTERRTMADAVLDQAERDGRPVLLMTTAPSASPPPAAGLMTAAAAREALAAVQPKPWSTDRAAALAREDVIAEAGQGAQVLWFSDGLEGGDRAATLEALQALGPVTVFRNAAGPGAMVLRPPRAEGAALRLVAERTPPLAETTVWVRLLAEDGRVLAREALSFAADEARAEAPAVLPAELRNRLARLVIEDRQTAAAVVLTDERWRRRPVGLVGAAAGFADQPLVNPLYYLRRALEPTTEVREGTVADLLARELAVLVLADPGRLPANDVRAVAEWVDRGGLLLQFAGPRLARVAGEAADPARSLLPVPLRAGGRVIDGALSWARPAALAPFPEIGPFRGLPVPEDVRIRRQVLAQPSLDLAAHTWARLTDGTPLVTADRRGEGWVVLVHVTADTAWSDLPLSGLFVHLLERLVALSQGAVSGPGGPPLAPLDILDGFGRLGPPPPGGLPIAGAQFDDATVSPSHPPGYYGAGPVRRAHNLSAGLVLPQPLGPLPEGVEEEAYDAPREVDLVPWLWGLALLLAVADLAASLALRGLLPVWRVAGAGAVLVVAGPAAGDDGFALEASLQTRLAYVVTGDEQVDSLSLAGLRGLSFVVNRRTAAELGEPLGVRPERDDLAFFPLLYWPVAAGTPLSEPALARLKAFLGNGGTVLMDTRAGPDGVEGALPPGLVQALDVPPLVPVPPDHVLTRAYYLLDDFPGRWTGRRVWVEQAGGADLDGVSAVVMGAHDWVGAWAVDDTQRPLYAVVPGGERQREMAYRFGINLVMYTLTGNYKADQVHLPAILERLGR